MNVKKISFGLFLIGCSALAGCSDSISVDQTGGATPGSPASLIDGELPGDETDTLNPPAAIPQPNTGVTIVDPNLPAVNPLNALQVLGDGVWRIAGNQDDQIGTDPGIGQLRFGVTQVVLQRQGGGYLMKRCTEQGISQSFEAIGFAGLDNFTSPACQSPNRRFGSNGSNEVSFETDCADGVTRSRLVATQVSTANDVQAGNLSFTSDQAANGSFSQFVCGELNHLSDNSDTTLPGGEVVGQTEVFVVGSDVTTAGALRMRFNKNKRTGRYDIGSGAPGAAAAPNTVEVIGTFAGRQVQATGGFVQLNSITESRAEGVVEVVMSDGDRIQGNFSVGL